MSENPQFFLSGFADEAGIMIDEQIRVLKINGIKAIELRSVNGQSIMATSEAEKADIRALLRQHGFVVSSIGSPVGKSLITQDFAIEQARLLRALDTAVFFESQYVRVFSFYIPEGEVPERYREEVLRRMGLMTEMAAEKGIILALENESGIYTDIPERCLEVMEAIPSSHLQMAFDSGNFIMNRAEPYPMAYQLLRERIAYFHIKDAAPGEKHFLPAGQGCGRIGEMLQEAYAEGFNGWLSLEPHLKYRSELNTAQQFTTAANALKAVLRCQLGTELAPVSLEGVESYD
jgi:Sugar phosphate isomerases/epimerases